MTTAQLADLRPRMTEEEFMRLPRDGRKYELVDGRLLEVPTSSEHDAINFQIVMLIAPYVKGRGAGTTGQGGFRMADGNIRVPDVSFKRKERLPGGKPPREFGAGAPDFCVEVTSPSEGPMDMQEKLEDYFASGAQIVWHVFPERREVIVYTSLTDSVTLSEHEKLMGGDLLPGFSCRVSEIFDAD